MAPKRGRRGGRKLASTVVEEVLVEERQVSSAYNLPAPPSLEATVPLRLLDGFTIFTADEEGVEQLTSLAALEKGLAEGLTLQASGLVLDHRTADESAAEAHAGAYVRVRIPRVLDWVLDYSDTAAIWIVTRAAWYRLLSPASEYVAYFAPMLERLKMARGCAFSMQAALTASLEDALQDVESGAGRPVAEQDDLETADSEDRWIGDEVPEWDPYATAMANPPSGSDVLREAAFLAPQLAPFLGRHAPKSGLLQGLAKRAGIAMDTITTQGRPLLRLQTSSSRADPALRPEPHSNFLAPAPLLPGILMVWDFCQSFRALLRLPPFPLTRLELAFMNHAPPESAAAQLAALRPATPTPSAAPSRSTTPVPGAQPGIAPKASTSTAPGEASAAPKPGMPTSALAPPTAAGAVGASKASAPEMPTVQWGVSGQGALLKDVHLCLLRILEGLDEELQEAPTMAGYGSAAELGPQEIYKPLLSVTWPELVRHALEDFCAQNPDSEAAGAAQELKVTEYSSLSGKTRLALLEALIAVAADTEIVRDYLQDNAPDTVNDRLPRGVPLGIDASGSRYFLLAAESGMHRLFVNSRGEDSDESAEGSWGWYSAEELPRLLAWLESGDSAERELAEDLHEAFLPQLQAMAQAAEESELPGTQPGALADGYRNAKAEGGFVATLLNELLSLFKGVRFWEKDANWLRARSAVIVELQRACSGLDFARLMWLMEDLMYGDLLKGTGWGRKRTWFREQLEACSTFSKAAVVACQLALHCRRSADMGFMSMEEFKLGLAKCRVAPQYIPLPGMEAVLSRRGYAAHCANARLPANTGAAPLPDVWSHTEHVRAKEIMFVRGNWQRPTWQGRFAGGPAPPHPYAEDLIVACLLIQRKGPENGSESTTGEIDWRGFTFQNGFRQPRQTHTVFGVRGKTPPTGSLSPSPSPSPLVATWALPPTAKVEVQAGPGANIGPGIALSKISAEVPTSRTEGAGTEATSAAPAAVKSEVTDVPVKAEHIGQDIAASSSIATKVEDGAIQNQKGSSVDASSAAATQPEHAVVANPLLKPDIETAPKPSTAVSSFPQSPAVAIQANPSAGSSQSVVGNGDGSTGMQPGSTSVEPASAASPASGSATPSHTPSNINGALAQPGTTAVQLHAPTPVANGAGPSSTPAQSYHTPAATPAATGAHPASHAANGGAAYVGGRQFEQRPIASGGIGNGWAPTTSRMAPASQGGQLPGLKLEGPQGYGNYGGVMHERTSAAGVPAGVGMWTPGQELPPRQRGRRDRSGADADGERSVSTRRSQRGSAAELFQLEKGNIAVARKQEASGPMGLRGLPGLGGGEGDDDASAEDLESIRYWTQERDLAAVTVYVRTAGPPGIEFLIQPSQYAMGMSRTWPRGLPVKMPAFGRLSAALNAPQPQPASRWITGVLTSSYPFNAISASFLRTQAPLPGGPQVPGRPPASVLPLQSSTPMPANFLTAALSTAAGMPVPGRPPGAGFTLPGSTLAAGSSNTQPSILAPSTPSQPAVPHTGPSNGASLVTAAASTGVSRAASGVTAPQTASSTVMAQQGQVASLPAQQHSALPMQPSSVPHAAAGTLQPASLALPAGPPGVGAPTPNMLLNGSAAGNSGIHSSAIQAYGVPLNFPAQRSGLAQTSSTGRLPGLRLGELVGRGIGGPQGAGGGALPGFGGVQDPWKALEVKWEDAPMHWPTRVSPWEIVEDIGGVVRAERARLREEAYRANMAARAAAEAKRAEMLARSQLAQQQYYAQHNAQAMRAGQTGPQGVIQQPTGVADAARLAALRAAQQTAVPGGQAQAARSAPMSYTALLAASGPLPTASNFSFPSQPNPQGFPRGAPQRPVAPGRPGQTIAPGAQNSVPGQQIMGPNAVPGGNWTAQPAKAGVHTVQSSVPQGVQSGLQKQLPGRTAASGQVVPGGAIAGVPVWMPAKPGQAAAAPTISPTAPSAAQPHSASTSPEEQAEGGRQGRKRGRSEDKAAAKGSTEGYRDRWLAKRPRPNPTSWLSAFCSICERPTPQGLLVCMGPCLRSFHMACLGLEQAPQEPWFCPECDSGRMRCFICGQFSSAFDDLSLRKCSLGVCGRFYHLACAERNPLTQMAKKGAHFRCPQHYCAQCSRSGDGVDMTKCIRCPTAYHTSCLPQGAHKLLAQSKVILCAKHQAGELPPPYVHPKDADSLAAKVTAESAAPSAGTAPAAAAASVPSPTSASAATTASLTAEPAAAASEQAPSDPGRIEPPSLPTAQHALESGKQPMLEAAAEEPILPGGPAAAPMRE